MDYTTLTDSELQEIFHAASEETSRRNLITAAMRREPILQTGSMVALGRAEGEEYVQPTGHHDAYPKGWEVQHDGKIWVSLTDANVWVPGETGWREVTDGGAPAEWVQPSGVHDAYQTGDRVTFQGAVWESVLDGNVWSPTDYPAGWKKL